MDKKIKVSKDTVPNYPLKVPGKLIRKQNGAIIFRHGLSSYAVNGIASAYKYKDIGPIWRDYEDLEGIGAKVSIGWLIQIANRL